MTSNKEMSKNQILYEQDIYLLSDPVSHRFKGFDVDKDNFAAELLFAFPLDPNESCSHGSINASGEMIVPKKTMKKVSEILREEYVSLWRDTSPKKRGYRTIDRGDRIDLMDQHHRLRAEKEILERFKSPDEVMRQKLSKIGLNEETRKKWVQNLEMVAQKANYRFAQNLPENSNSLLVIDGIPWIDKVDKLYQRIGYKIKQRESSKQYYGVKWSEKIASTIDNRDGDKTLFEKNLVEANEVLDLILVNKLNGMREYYGEDLDLNDFQKCLEMMWNDIPGRNSNNSLDEKSFRATVAAIRFSPETLAKEKDDIVLLMNKGAAQSKVVLAWMLRLADKSQKLIDEGAPFTPELSMCNQDIGMHWAAKIQSEPQISVTEEDTNIDWWTVMIDHIRRAYGESKGAQFFNDNIEKYTRRTEYDDPLVLGLFLQGGHQLSWLPVERNFVWALYHNPKALVAMIDELKEAFSYPYDDGPKVLDLCCRLAEFGINDELIRSNRDSSSHNQRF